MHDALHSTAGASHTWLGSKSIASALCSKNAEPLVSMMRTLLLPPAAMRPEAGECAMVVHTSSICRQGLGSQARDWATGVLMVLCGEHGPGVLMVLCGRHRMADGAA